MTKAKKVVIVGGWPGGLASANATTASVLISPIWLVCLPHVSQFVGDLERPHEERDRGSGRRRAHCAHRGTSKTGRSRQLAPENLDVRFTHAETSLHLPFFYHRRQDAEQDFAFIALRAESAARTDALLQSSPRRHLIVTAACFYRNDQQGALDAYQRYASTGAAREVRTRRDG
jgi:hypothetical protein